MVKHMLAVGVIMEKLAKYFCENTDLWYLTGLLHDIDYELTSGNMGEQQV